MAGSAVDVRPVSDGVGSKRGRESSPGLREEDGTSAKVSKPVSNMWAEGRTGGIYIPPHRLRKMQESIAEDKTSREYQRMQWELLKKRINGVVNKVNVSNLAEIAVAMFRENLIRGKGLFCRAVLKAQLSSPEFTNVYTALVAVVNSKMPEVGELLLSRVIMQFRRSYRRNDKITCMSATKFVAQLVNQQVAHEILALQLVTLLLEKPTSDSVEVSISFVKECGALLTEVSPQGIHAVFERLRSILHEGEIDKRVQYMIEALFSVRRSGFSEYPIVLEDLDVVEDEDKITHELSLDDELDLATGFDVFQYDADYEENEKKYAEIRKEILGDDENASGDEDEDSEESGDDAREGGDQARVEVDDQTGREDVEFRRRIYLTIMSALSYEECAHKLMKLMSGKDGKEPSLCQMLLECCGQERSYLSFYGLLGCRFCALNRLYVAAFESLFAEYYGEVHRFETSRIRNVAKFFAALLASGSMPWSIFELISINEDETTSSSRIFLKVMFQEVVAEMGLESFHKQLVVEEIQPYLRGILPKDSPQNARFAINFFTSIGLGAITEELREHLKTMPKIVPTELPKDESDDTSSSDSSKAPPTPIEPKANGREENSREPSSREANGRGGRRDRPTERSRSRSPRPAGEERNQHVRRGATGPRRDYPPIEGRGRGRGMTKPAWMAEKREGRGPHSPRRDTRQSPRRREPHGRGPGRGRYNRRFENRSRSPIAETRYRQDPDQGQLRDQGARLGDDPEEVHRRADLLAAPQYTQERLENARVLEARAAASSSGG
ncbi:hypothetical protein NDN08_003311 [Rhodosorus marinus]|uniref:MI domain-containing protein n=1 Tax=Rhodosorus marinus TaxID=101924 RepID=A0AAV8UW53_9RHOD|nr:hypothetical protein NDN08_003311 [Rhodosorus marinus]